MANESGTQVIYAERLMMRAMPLDKPAVRIEGNVIRRSGFSAVRAAARIKIATSDQSP
jgi:hypothetical protein